MLRVRLPYRSRPRFLPQGWEGNDELIADGGRNGLFGGDDDDTLIATGTVDYLRGDAGADSCTLNGGRKVEGDGSFSDPYRGCE